MNQLTKTVFYNLNIDDIFKFSVNCHTCNNIIINRQYFNKKHFNSLFYIASNLSKLKKLIYIKG